MSGAASSVRPAHRASLDGLRALAFLAVFWNHARPDSYNWGAMGVQVFFALSGFLITRILVRSETGQLGPDLRRFYTRRTLRIFPLYYALILLVGLTRGWVAPLWHLTYTYNIQVYLAHGFDDVLAHFWTLCVEEQFYLIYPVIFWLTPARLRLGLLVGTLAASKGFQVHAHAALEMPWPRILLPYCGEYLLWGCLAGWLDLRLGPGTGGGRTSFILGLPLIVLGWKLHEHRVPALPAPWQDALGVSALGMGSASVVFGAWRTRDRWIVAPLACRPIAALGRISYGLYAFHMPVIHLHWLDAIPFAFLIPRPYGDLGLTILLAALSWRYFEGPINRQKERLAPPHGG